MLFPRVAIPACIPTNSIREFALLHILANTFYRTPLLDRRQLRRARWRWYATREFFPARSW